MHAPLAPGDPEGHPLTYDVVDVFTDRPYAGNPLAVVHGTSDLSTAQLQHLARELNLSETAFPTVVDDSTYRLRIFTPAVELPFAGHPSVGTAWVLRSRGLVSGPVLRQECGAGVVRLELDERPDGVVRLTGAAPTLEPVPDDECSAALAAVGLGAADLAGPAPVLAGTGLPFCYLLVRPDALERVAPDLGRLQAMHAARPSLGGVVVASVGEPAGGGCEVRVLSGDLGGAVEDAATGSAALGLGVALVASGVLPDDGRHDVEIAQGARIGRPSALHLRVDASSGRAVSCSVGGQVVPVATGTLRTPPP